MKRFRKTVVGVELDATAHEPTLGARLAVNQALWLAERVNCHVTLVHSRAADERWDPGTSGYVTQPASSPTTDAQALEKLEDEFCQRGVQCAVVSTPEDAWLAITRQVLDEDADLVVVGKRAHADGDSRRIGSVTNKLLRKCPAAVWAVDPDSDPIPDVVLAATDLSPVGNRVVEVGASLAVEFGSQLHVVHAYELPIAVQMEGDRARSEFERQARSDAVEAIESQLRGIPLDRAADLHVGLTTPTRAVLECVERLTPALVVLGTISRGGIAGVFVGNTAERLLGRLHCSLLAVKPEDFISPVERSAPPS